MSTNGAAPPVDLRTALRHGLAPDGGLYLPDSLRPLPDAAVRALRGAAWAEIASTVAAHLLAGELDRVTIDAVVSEALDFPVPLVPVTERVYALELFHGPTFAFKDVGARFLARAFAATRASDDAITVLTATSGDTGGAVAHAFHGMPGMRVVILFPQGQVSPLQERQFTTLGGNVQSVAVRGTFDDCQRLVKEAFTDRDLVGALQLTSANSINVGRLLPQVLYYFHAWAHLPIADAIVSVPSGNFGNLAAGLIAKRLGLPALRFVAATNVNDAVPEYLRTGRFTPRPSIRTISSAMDVGNPSNLDRIVALYRDQPDRLRRDVSGRSFSDDATRACIGSTARHHDYLLDPHSAVGMLGIEEELQEHPGAVGVVLATAHPAKFADVVESASGRSVELPAALDTLRQRESRPEVIRPDQRALNSLLQNG
ncbi:MAG: threonine synthase [Gemmatimonadales bacterium]|nr:threonine synthase [Gemmatimonadales bacterium]